MRGMYFSTNLILVNAINHLIYFNQNPPASYVSPSVRVSLSLTFFISWNYLSSLFR